MRITGNAVLNAPADRVWAALNDPGVLARTIPGCERLEEVGPNRYTMTVTAGVASIKGTYQGDVSLADPLPPDSFTLRASGTGAPGTVRADVRITLACVDGLTTTVTYDADALVGGPVGGVGQRVIAAVAKKTAAQFFSAVSGEISGSPVEVADRTDGGPVVGSAPASVPSGTAGGVTGWPGRTAAQRIPLPSGKVGVDVGSALFGAAVALVGVLVGVLAGRRR